MRDLIERWRARAKAQRELGGHNTASVIDQMIIDLDLRLEKLAEGQAEPTRDGYYFVEGMLRPLFVVRVIDEWRVWPVAENTFPLNGRRVWPIADPRKGGA